MVLHTAESKVDGGQTSGGRAGETYTRSMGVLSGGEIDGHYVSSWKWEEGGDKMD